MVEVDLLCEGPPTSNTAERFLSSMDSLVTFQIAFLGEPFPTQAAPMGFLAGVDDIMNP